MMTLLLRRGAALTALLPLAAAAQVPPWRSAADGSVRRVRPVMPAASPEVVTPSPRRVPRDDVPLIVHRRCTREELAHLPHDPDQQFGAGPQVPIGRALLDPWTARTALLVSLLYLDCGLAVPDTAAPPAADHSGRPSARDATDSVRSRPPHAGAPTPPASGA